MYVEHRHFIFGISVYALPITKCFDHYFIAYFSAREIRFTSVV